MWYYICGTGYLLRITYRPRSPGFDIHLCHLRSTDIRSGSAMKLFTQPSTSLRTPYMVYYVVLLWP
jgi:hypothetical protein